MKLIPLLAMSNNKEYLKFCSEISPSTYLFSADASIKHKTLQKLKRGQCKIDASLDLHGFTLTQAQEVLEEFMQESLLDHLRTLLIIHGKGTQAILKNYVNRWLEEHTQVLAFCSAKPKDGGLGAVYVLLKRQKYHGDDEDE